VSPVNVPPSATVLPIFDRPLAAAVIPVLAIPLSLITRLPSLTPAPYQYSTLPIFTVRPTYLCDSTIAVLTAATSAYGWFVEAKYFESIGLPTLTLKLSFIILAIFFRF